MLEEVSAGVESHLKLAPAPTPGTQKEYLAWERELMGLYVSSHPLDNYATYFTEQTVPLSRITPTIDGRPVTVGGIISTVRTIVTKSGTKMAFVKIEDKVHEAEIVVFPNLFEQVGAKLQQDTIIRVDGRVNARDRDGNLRDEASVIAQDIIEITDDELKNYESTGRTMSGPKASSAAKRQYKQQHARSAAATAKPSQPLKKMTAEPTARAIKSAPLPQTLYVRILDPDNISQLESLKNHCLAHPGSLQVVLVLGAEKSAMRLQFKVDGSLELVEALKEVLGQDAVILK